MGYQLWVPDHQEILVGVHVTFNEVIPSYREEYFNELNKLSFEVAPDECTVDSFQHLVGENYFDDDTQLEFVTTRVTLWKDMIVAYRAPVLNGKTGREEKSPIHVANVMRMRESNFAPMSGSGQPTAVVAEGGRTVERTAEYNSEANSVEALRRTRFNLREAQAELSEEQAADEVRTHRLQRTVDDSGTRRLPSAVDDAAGECRSGRESQLA